MSHRECPRCGRNTLRRNGSHHGKPRWICRDGSGDRRMCYTTVDPDAPYRGPDGRSKGRQANAQFRRSLGRSKRFVVTAAQNATPVHEGFFRALLAYCEETGAELIVVPIRYKNPTSRWSASQAGEETWDERLVPYLYNQRKKLCDSLVLLGDIKTQPTAVTPLSGFESITHHESGILGHTKVQLTTIPTMPGQLPKIMTTTGAVTLPNYTDSKAGKKGEFHHSLAAVAVTVVGKRFFMHQLSAERSGRFQNRDRIYHEDGTVSDGHRLLALVTGDTHRVMIDPGVERATYGPGGMVEVLEPEYLVFHDLHDGYARNPHHAGDPFVELAKRQSDMHQVEREVRDDVAWLNRVCAGRKGVVVASNHDAFLSRWIRDTDWRRDPENAEFYLQTALAMVRSVKMTGSGSHVIDPYAHWVEQLGADNIRCLRSDESFALAGVELSLHGDRGPNGARGTRRNLQRIGVRTIIGHSHSPGIDEGCYQCGTSTPLRLEYNAGPSSWMHAHTWLYPSGKRSLAFIVGGAWQ